MISTTTLWLLPMVMQGSASLWVIGRLTTKRLNTHPGLSEPSRKAFRHLRRAQTVAASNWRNLVVSKRPFTTAGFGMFAPYLRRSELPMYLASSPIRAQA